MKRIRNALILLLPVQHFKNQLSMESIHSIYLCVPNKNWWVKRVTDLSSKLKIAHPFWPLDSSFYTLGDISLACTCHDWRLRFWCSSPTFCLPVFEFSAEQILLQSCCTAEKQHSEIVWTFVLAMALVLVVRTECLLILRQAVSKRTSKQRTCKKGDKWPDLIIRCVIE